MAYNSDGYIMIDFTEVDFRRTNQTIDGLYKRCVDVIGTNKFILVINANGRTPLPATCSFKNNQYVIDTCIYMFAISSNDNLFIRRNDVPASDIIDDSSVSVDKTWSSNKIDTELDSKQDVLTAGTNITIDENNVISATGGGAVIDDSVIVNNKVWSSLNTVEMLAPIDTVVGSPATFKTSLALPIVACTTPFTVTQEGTGDPTPLNIRNINYIDEIIITHNSTPIIFNLGGHRAIGILNIAEKSITVTHDILIFDGSDDEAWVTNSNNGVSYNIDSGTNTYYNVIYCNEFIPTPAKTGSTLNNYEIALNLSKVNLLVKYDDALTAELFKSYLSNNNLQVVLRRETPQTIMLSDIPILSTVIGNNTFASDTGSLTVSYKVLPIDLL